MFSFLNFIQSILAKLKKNKGVWFTVLTVLSVLGVLSSITLMNMMTSDVAKKTYLEVHRVDITELENTLDSKYNSLLSIGGVLAIHPDIIKNIKSKSDKSVADILLETQNVINERVDIEPILVKHYALNYEASDSENDKYANLVMETQASITGIVVNSNGVRIIAITAIMDGNATIGAIEVSQDIIAVKNSFDRLGKEFIFILDKSQLVFMDLGTKQGMTQDIDDRYKIFFHDYSSQFFVNLRKHDLDTLKREKYAVDDYYYTTYDETVDIDGKEIGLFVIGESAQGANSFVNITKNLIGSVTTVALGLIISLILFMF